MRRKSEPDFVYAGFEEQMGPIVDGMNEALSHPAAEVFIMPKAVDAVANFSQTRRQQMLISRPTGIMAGLIRLHDEDYGGNA